MNACSALCSSHSTSFCLPLQYGAKRSLAARFGDLSWFTVAEAGFYELIKSCRSSRGHIFACLLTLFFCRALAMLRLFALVATPGFSVLELPEVCTSRVLGLCRSSLMMYFKIGLTIHLFTWLTRSLLLFFPKRITALMLFSCRGPVYIHLGNSWLNWLFWVAVFEASVEWEHAAVSDVWECSCSLTARNIIPI